MTVVVGVGVAGLSAAVLLAEAGTAVRVIAEQLPGVTSPAADAMGGASRASRGEPCRLPIGQLREKCFSRTRGWFRHAARRGHPPGPPIRTHDHAWHPTDHEGLTLIHRPNGKTQPSCACPKPGWSNAAKRRRFGRG
jgi:hypothetical protein